MPSLKGVVKDLVGSVPSNRLTVPGICEWITNKRPDVITEVLWSDELKAGAHGDTPCILSPGCDHEVVAASEILHRETWDYIHRHGGSLYCGRRHVERGSSHQLFDGSALSWIEFSRSARLAVQIMFAELQSCDDYKKLAEKSFEHRAGSVRFERALVAALRRNIRNVVDNTNEKLSSLISPSASQTFNVELETVATSQRQSSKKGTAKTQETVADADVTLNLRFSFPSIAFTETHRVPINVKAVQDENTREIQSGAGSMFAWVMHSTDGIGSLSDFIADSAAHGGIEMTNGTPADYFFAVFRKDDSSASPQISSLLTLDPAQGCLPANRHRPFPGFGLDVKRSTGAGVITATVVEARRRLLNHILGQQIAEARRLFEDIESLKAMANDPNVEETTPGQLPLN